MAFASALLQGQDTSEVIRFGTTGGRASVLTMTPEAIRRDEAERLAGEVVVRGKA